MIPPAAVAVIAAAIEDATRHGHGPQEAAQAAATALRSAGWTITPTGVENGPHTATQEFATRVAPHTHTH